MRTGSLLALSLFCMITSKASATTTRSWHPFECTVYPNQSEFSLVGAGQLEHSGTSSYLPFYCPVVSDATVAPASATQATFTGWANSYAFEVLACRTYYDGSGGSCGTASVSGTSSVNHVHPSLSAWSGGASNDTYYLEVVTMPPSSGSYQTFWEYDVTQ